MKDKNFRHNSDIIERLEQLTNAQVTILETILDEFSKPISCKVHKTDFLTEDNFEYFTERIKLHHANSIDPLRKEHFEHVLEQTLRDSGRIVSRETSKTTRGRDLTVDGIGISLKSESAKNTKPDKIKISKLMEAVWIKQLTSKEELPQFLRQNVLDHFNNYERVFTLRTYFSRLREELIYDLREILVEDFRLISHLEPNDFSDLTKTNTTSATVKKLGKDLFKLRLDGSDDKITIDNLNCDFCPLHCRWTLPIENQG